jgi:outer membrane receptor for ferrienterochelin and colicins
MTQKTKWTAIPIVPLAPCALARAVALGALMFVGSIARADAQAVDYGALQQLFGEPVTTSATGSPQRATDVPADMEIITADEIRRSGADNIPDILQFVAGVDVRRYAFGQSEVSVRGYDQQASPRLLVLINGRQVYLDDYGYTAWQSLPVQIEEIRQIEVVRGPNSALFGFNAAGGVINIITFDPLLDSTNEATVRGGTQGYASGSAVLTVHDGDQAALRLSAGGFQADEFSTNSAPAALGPFDRSPSEFSFGADGTLKLGPKVELTAEATATNSQMFQVIPLPRFDSEASQTNSIKLGLAADTSLGLFNLTAYRNGFEFTIENVSPEVSEHNQTYVVQANDVFKLGADNTLRIGFEYRDNSVTSVIVGGTIGYDVEAASAMWNWQITPELSLTNAGRLDHLSLRFNGVTVPGDQYPASEYNNAELNEFSFNSGLVYRPTDDDTIRLLVARGIQAPSLLDFGLEETYPIPGGTYSLIGSPDLRAASVLNYEIDYDRVLSPNAGLHVAVYDQRTAELIASALNTPIVPVAGGLASYSENVGSSGAVGTEIGLKGATEQGIRWNLSYSYISISDHLTVSPLTGSSGLLDYDAGSPAHVVDAGLGYSWDRLDVDAQARWQSRFFDYNPTTSTAQQFRIDNYMTMSARIGYRVTDNLTFAVSGEQLLQSQIFEAAGLPVERRIFVSINDKF